MDLIKKVAAYVTKGVFFNYCLSDTVLCLVIDATCIQSPGASSWLPIKYL